MTWSGGSNTEVFGRLYGPPVEGPQPVEVTPPVETTAKSPPVGNTRAGGTLPAGTLLLLFTAALLRRRPRGAGRTSGSR